LHPTTHTLFPYTTLFRSCATIETTLTPDRQKQLDTILAGQDKVFAKFKGEVGRINLEEGSIRLTENTPITLRPYRCTAEDQKIKIGRASCRERVESAGGE